MPVDLIPNIVCEGFFLRDGETPFVKAVPIFQNSNASL